MHKLKGNYGHNYTHLNQNIKYSHYLELSNDEKIPCTICREIVIQNGKKVITRLTSQWITGTVL